VDIHIANEGQIGEFIAVDSVCVESTFEDMHHTQNLGKISILKYLWEGKLTSNMTIISTHAPSCDGFWFKLSEFSEAFLGFLSAAIVA
jgi:hypothetical protein